MIGVRCPTATSMEHARVCQDAQRGLHQTHRRYGRRCEDAVVVFDERGVYALVGPEFKGGAHGLQLHREGGTEYLYLCDTRRRFAVKHAGGRRGPSVPFPGGDGLYARENEYCRPTWRLHRRHRFVADGYGKSYVHRYTRCSTSIRLRRGEGARLHQLSAWVAVDCRGPEPVLVVADRGNRRLQYFSLDGKHLRFVTEELRAPCILTNEDRAAGPDLESRVTLLDATTS